MNDKHAKPGDTIVITKANDFQGQEFLVVECPENRKDGPHSHCAWVEHLGTVVSVFDPKHYKIVKRTEKHQSTNDINALVKEQMDDNLRSVFE